MTVGTVSTFTFANLSLFWWQYSCAFTEAKNLKVGLLLATEYCYFYISTQTKYFLHLWLWQAVPLPAAKYFNMHAQTIIWRKESSTLIFKDIAQCWMDVSATLTLWRNSSALCTLIHSAVAACNRSCSLNSQLVLLRCSWPSINLTEIWNSSCVRSWANQTKNFSFWAAWLLHTYV